MAIDTSLSAPSASSDSFAFGQPLAAATTQATTPQPANVYAHPSPWRTQDRQAGSESFIDARIPPAYDPAAKYRSGDSVSMNGRVFTLAQAPGAPKIMGIAPDAGFAVGLNPWWYQGGTRNFHAPWSNSAASASAGAPVDESANAHPNMRVTVRGNRIAIELPVRFDGSGLTPQRQAAMVDTIQRSWSGHFGPYDVATSVIAPSPYASANEVNTVTVLDGPGMSNTNQNQVTIYTSEPGRTPYSNAELGHVAAHEAGHLMGEVDRYALTETHGMPDHVTDPGYEHNLMGNRYGAVDQRNIDSILRRVR